MSYDGAVGFVAGVGTVGLLHLAWFLWFNRPRGIRWPRHYRAICVGCTNAAVSDTGVRSGD